MWGVNNWTGSLASSLSCLVDILAEVALELKAGPEATSMKGLLYKASAEDGRFPIIRIWKPRQAGG